MVDIFRKSVSSTIHGIGIIAKMATIGLGGECNTAAPVLSFGIITDIQYADQPNGTNFTKDKIRYYRNSINILRGAVDHWKSSMYKIKFVLQLGDIVDGQNSKTVGASDKSLAEIIEVFSELECPKYHAVGNHELYNFQRSTLQQSVLYSCRDADVIAPEGGSAGNYYHFSPLKGFRIVVLDTYEVSLLGHEKDSADYLKTLSFFRQYNQNEETHDPSGLPVEHCMYAAFNGAVSQSQLQWLENVLTEAESKNERVIVSGHIPICEGSAVNQCLCWNHDSIRAILRRHHTCVLAYLAGHDHSGGYRRDDLGIFYVTFQGVVDTAPGNSCYATAHVYEDKVILQGSGMIPSYTLSYYEKLQ